MINASCVRVTKTRTYVRPPICCVHNRARSRFWLTIMRGINPLMGKHVCCVWQLVRRCGWHTKTMQEAHHHRHQSSQIRRMWHMARRYYAIHGTRASLVFVSFNTRHVLIVSNTAYSKTFEVHVRGTPYTWMWCRLVLFGLIRIHNTSRCSAELTENAGWMCSNQSHH